VATLGHNDIALVVERRKIRVRFVSSALNFSSFHPSSLLLFLFFQVMTGWAECTSRMYLLPNHQTLISTGMYLRKAD
jgi:hypothetical protein